MRLLCDRVDCKVALVENALYDDLAMRRVLWRARKDGWSIGKGDESQDLCPMHAREAAWFGVRIDLPPPPTLDEMRARMFLSPRELRRVYADHDSGDESDRPYGLILHSRYFRGAL